MHTAGHLGGDDESPQPSRLQSERGRVLDEGFLTLDERNRVLLVGVCAHQPNLALTVLCVTILSGPDRQRQSLEQA